MARAHDSPGMRPLPAAPTPCPLRPPREHGGSRLSLQGGTRSPRAGARTPEFTGWRAQAETRRKGLLGRPLTSPLRAGRGRYTTGASALGAAWDGARTSQDTRREARPVWAASPRSPSSRGPCELGGANDRSLEASGPERGGRGSRPTWPRDFTAWPDFKSIAMVQEEGRYLLKLFSFCCIVHR